MQHGISISAVKFNNEPFTRSLTATIMSVVDTRFLPASGPGVVIWDSINPFFDSGVYATNLSGVTYNIGTTAQVSAFGTLIFYFSAPTYDYFSEPYSLFNLTIGATFLSGSPLSSIQLTSIDIPYDSFPAINLSAYLNYQFTESNDFFYRLTNASSYIANLSLSSTAFNLTSSLSTNYFKTSISLNNTSTTYNFLSTFSFNRTVPTLSSVKITLSALSAVGSLSAWYSPHTLERSLTAIFVNSFISAAPFIAYPGEYFDTYFTRQAITPSNLSASPGLSFYGEGHTEKIYLSSQPSSNVTKYVWKFGDYTNLYTPLVSGTTGQLSSAIVSISSSIGSYPKIPIQLQATNSTFLSTSPLFYYDDNTGQKIFYPYVVSTVDPNGNELSTSKYFSSIVVQPYDASQYIFIPGAPSTVYLPNDGSPVSYSASLQVELTANTIDPCFQLYGIDWKWSTFENCSATNTFTNRPSTWASTQCSVSAGTLTATDVGAKYRKKWGYEPPLSANLFLTSPVFCTPGTTTWYLCTDRWSRSPQANSFTVNPAQYSYSLRLSGYGTSLLTVSYYENTLVTLNVQKPITCQINVQSYGQPSDWQPKTTNIDLTHQILSIPPPDLKFYTPNRFVLTGIPIKFENITTAFSTLCSLTATFNDETPDIILNRPNINESLYVTFSSLGQKSITVTGTVFYEDALVIINLPNIVNVIAEYDQVEPTAYRSTFTPLELPYPNKIEIGANDWAVADVFNSCIEKFYKNLEYLETRGKIYNGSYSDYFGWLGPLPLTIAPTITTCPIYMWQELNCETLYTFDGPIEQTGTTWRDALSTDTFVGDFAPCATWLQQTCSTRKVSPGCFQKYCTTWQWKTRKQANTDLPITWKQTKCDEVYEKKWYFEPCDVAPPVVCDEGFWNVNIPKLDTYYDPMGNCQVQQPCNYYGVYSHNNILYVAQKTQVKVLSSDYQATPITQLNLFDEVTSFNNIKNICLDSLGRVIVLDGDLLQVGVYTLNGVVWESFISWGGVGTTNSRSKFLNPNDIHIDSKDRIWVTDTGNKCIKVFSNTGSWIATIKNEEFDETPPLSVCVDSQNNIHVLTSKQISVYDIDGNVLYSYDYKTYVTGNAVRINTSYNKEIIYLCTSTQVVKFFRNGKFNGYIIDSKACVNNITSIFQDEFRNLLITSNDKVLKYPDLMTLINLKGVLPDYYWPLEELYIHPEEYIQNWVYNKSLQRLWDCIEIFRSTILFNSLDGCKCYSAPIYQKEDIVVGQNEIVTSTVINRCFGYLWENFMTFVNYFNPSCTSQTCQTIEIGPAIPFEPTE